VETGDPAREGEESDEEIEFIGRIQREMLQLCIELLGHPLQDNEYKSASISSLAVLGIRDNMGGWMQRIITPNILLSLN
jgi:hypothetical protein